MLQRLQRKKARSHGYLSLLLGLALLLGGCGTGDETPASIELHVSVAASLTDVMTELESQFEEKHPRIDLIINYGSSGALQQQVEQGAPTDVFFSAGMKQMEALVGKGLIVKVDTKPVIRNRLVVVVPASGGGKLERLADLTGPMWKRVAMGEPDTVPAGMYSRQVMEQEGVWGALQPKLVYAKDVRQVIAYVASGNVEAGWVYRTDAMLSDLVRVELEVDPKQHEAIVYPIGIVADTEHRDAAMALYEFVGGEQARALYEKYGFEPAMP